MVVPRAMNAATAKTVGPSARNRLSERDVLTFLRATAGNAWTPPEVSVRTSVALTIVMRSLRPLMTRNGVFRSGVTRGVAAKLTPWPNMNRHDPR